MAAGDSQPRIALVLAGGGARGAYEAGALSVLLPELDARGQRPRIVLGTSVGALNASFLAANAHLPVDELRTRALEIWRTVAWAEILRPLVSPPSLLRLGEYAGEVLGLPGLRLDSLLDPAPLWRTLRERVDFPQIERNVNDGVIDAAGVVATSALTGRSVVFHCGLDSPPADTGRGIDYVATPLLEEHVLASSAIPAVFPAVNVRHPRVARGWYFDGGTRLNTPVKPAIAFGADRVVVIALNSLAPGPKQLAGDKRPDALQGAGQILTGLLEDQLSADVQTLAMVNRLIDPEHPHALTPTTRAGKRRLPYIVIAPRTRDAIGKVALRVFRKHYSNPVGAVRAPDIALLGRLVGGGSDAQHAELLSYLMFASRFTEALAEVGRADAKRWLSEQHDLEDIWQLAPPD